MVSGTETLVDEHEGASHSAGHTYKLWFSVSLVVTRAGAGGSLLLLEFTGFKPLTVTVHVVDLKKKLLTRTRANRR